MLQEAPFNRNFQTLPRRFAGFNLNELGYFPKKSEKVLRTHHTFNYSIILSGSGRYSYDKRTVSVQTPCVITQHPGQGCNYGPFPGESWEELYLIFPSSCQKWIKEKKLLGQNEFIWPIRNIVPVLRAIRSLLSTINDTQRQAGKADLIDHFAERVIIETLLPSENASDSASEAIQKLAQNMATAPEKSYNFQQFAKDHALSYSTFQRRWRDIHPTPPNQHLLNLRISESCRLIVESQLKINQISDLLGFEDSAYFSRIFKQRIGVPPSQYRSFHLSAQE